SISMLPPEPKIFYGRDTELDNVLAMFRQPESPRVAIIGAGGIGKTALSQVVLHHTEIADRFQHHRYFVACDSAGTAVELAALVGTHLGLKPGKDLTRAVVSYFSKSPPCVLVLDNFESVWEPTQARRAVEEFLSLLADIAHLALMVTMRGAERPAKLKWTRPFLAPLGPLAQSAARQIFLDIADDGHDPADVDAIVALTGNMPLAISLLAHLADSEGCAAVLSRWEIEKTSLVSEGYDKRNNFDS
ncbi:P-loop containing nucleoside triphosphate hydrolase protein, partial [Mycena filopes]